MGTHLLVFQHTRWEGPGRYLVHLAKKKRVRLHIVNLWQESIPEVEDYDGLLVLGGSPNVDQEKQYPFLVAEKKAIRDVLQNDKPYFGYCLGHQLLAEALGVRVGQNFKTSIGFIKGYLTREGRRHPVFKGLPVQQTFFKWHSQAVIEPVPGHIQILATSSECQVEVISVFDHPHIVGMQADNHAAAPGDVSLWLEKDAKWLVSLGEEIPHPGDITAKAKKYAQSTQEEFEKTFSNWLGFF
jgi:GMP synthase-like glutamine amidotransferase